MAKKEARATKQARLTLGNWSVFTGIVGAICLSTISGAVAVNPATWGMSPLYLTAKLMLIILLVIHLLFVIFGFQVKSQPNREARLYTWALILMGILMLTIAWSSMMLIGMVLYGALLVLGVIELLA